MRSHFETAERSRFWTANFVNFVDIGPLLAAKQGAANVTKIPCLRGIENYTKNGPFRGTQERCPLKRGDERGIATWPNDFCG